jgi:hypothetical protein
LAALGDPIVALRDTSGKKTSSWSQTFHLLEDLLVNVRKGLSRYVVLRGTTGKKSVKFLYTWVNNMQIAEIDKNSFLQLSGSPIVESLSACKKSLLFTANYCLGPLHKMFRVLSVPRNVPSSKDFFQGPNAVSSTRISILLIKLMVQL